MNHIISRSHKPSERDICISLIHAFEYHRGKTINNTAYRIEQARNRLEDFNFIKNNPIVNERQFTIIHPYHPSKQEVKDFFKESSDLLKRNWGLTQKVITDTLNDEVLPEYENIITTEMRQTGGLLAPLYSEYHDITGALKIFNIKSQKNYTINNKNNECIGVFYPNPDLVKISGKSIVFVSDIETSILLQSNLPSEIVTCTLGKDRLISSIINHYDKNPSDFIIAVIDNPYTQYTYTIGPNDNLILGSELNLIFNAMIQQPQILAQIGILMPCVGIEGNNTNQNFASIAFQQNKQCADDLIISELVALGERRENKINEISYLNSVHAKYKKEVLQLFKIELPELSSLNEKRKNQNTEKNNPVLIANNQHEIRHLFNL